MKYKIFTILIIDLFLCLFCLFCLIPVGYGSQSIQQIFFQVVVIIGFSIFTWKFLDLVDAEVMFEMLISVIKVIIGIILLFIILIYVLIPITCSFF